MKNNLIQASKLTLIFVILFCVIYPLIVLGVSKLSSNNGKGKLITQNNKQYYANIGQSFTSNEYFWGRPSAAGYNAAGSCGSNKGPSNPDYLAEVNARIDSFMVHNPGISRNQIPSDLVTASGSGLDPNISVEAARVQVNRIALARKIDAQQLNNLITQNIESPVLGLFGPTKINVLQLNLQLTTLK